MKHIINIGILGTLLIFPIIPVNPQENYFSSNKGYTLKKFKKICKDIQFEKDYIICSNISNLFMMDKLSEYITIDEVREITQILTKTCKSIHKGSKDGSIYPYRVSGCVGQSLNNLAKGAKYQGKHPISWKGSELSFLRSGKYEICITEEHSFPFMSNEKDECRKYGQR